MNLYSEFEARFPRDDASPFLDLGGDRVVTYGELKAQTARVASMLVALGAKPGDRIAAQVEKCAESVFLYLGALRAGCVFLPMNPAYQSGELSHILADAAPHVLVVRPASIEACRQIAPRAGIAHVIELKDDGSGEFSRMLAEHAPVFQTVERGRTDLAAILYTSGTTGRAKGAMLSHDNLSVGVKTLHAFWGFAPGDVLLHILPIYHFHGLFVALHCALYNGSKVLFETKFDAGRAIGLLRSATVCMGVPTHYVRLLAEPALTPQACHGVRLFISGSAPLLPEVFRSFQQRTGQTILERYGMTEGGMFASNPYVGERRCGTVGPALPGMSIRVVDSANRSVEPDVTGSIQVKGANVFVGYWNLPEKTADEFTPDGYFKTGDLGRLSADQYLTIVGRDKDMIISGGLNIYPKEVEEVIDAMAGVGESAVIGLKHADFGEAVAAVVVLDASAGADLPDAAAIIAHVKSRLASFKVPKSVYIVTELPRNAMGKVQKVELRRRYAIADDGR